MVTALAAWSAVSGIAADTPPPAAERGAPSAIAAARLVEEEVFSARYSNNGASPMWCFGNTCLVRLGDRVFASIHEPLAGQPGPNDCRWSLFERTTDGWQRRHADPAGRTREPAPLACLPPSAEHPAGRVLLSANPTLLAPGVAGPGPARPELLVFDAASPGKRPVVLAPAWQGTPAFSEHSYRSLAVDRRRGEVFAMQYADATHGDWSFRDRNGGWLEIASSFSDGRWLFPGDIHVDDGGTVHLLWYRGPMLTSLRDARYPDIVRVHAIEYAQVRDGRTTRRATLHRGGEEGDATVPIDMADEERVYVTSGGERLVNQPVATPRFHVAPGGRLLVASYFGPADPVARTEWRGTLSYARVRLGGEPPSAD